jgi:hypothetical protein
MITIERNIIPSSSLMAFNVLMNEFPPALRRNIHEQGWKFYIEYTGKEYVAVAIHNSQIQRKEKYLSKTEITTVKREIKENENWLKRNKCKY